MDARGEMRSGSVELLWISVTLWRRRVSFVFASRKFHVHVLLGCLWCLLEAPSLLLPDVVAPGCAINKYSLAI